MSAVIIQVCVGSSCHIKGSREIIELLQKTVEDLQLEREVTLAGNFCVGKCNRVGVTIQVDDAVYEGITVEGFKEFFNEHVLKLLNRKEDKTGD